MDINEQTATLWKQRGIEKLRFAEQPKTEKGLVETTFNPAKHKVRSRAEAELIYEIDCKRYKGKDSKELNPQEKHEVKEIIKPIQEKNFERIKVLGYELFYSSHEGESPYLTNYNHKGLTATNAKEYARLFAEKYLEKLPAGFEYDYSLYNAEHWRPIEFQPHWKPENQGRIHKIIKLCNTNAEKEADAELLQKAKQAITQEKRKVALGYWEILKQINPSRKERTSCVMQIKESHKNFSQNDILDYIAKHNTWEDYNADYTAQQVQNVYQTYKDKPNPIKHEEARGVSSVKELYKTKPLNLITAKQIIKSKPDKRFIIKGWAYPNTIIIVVGAPGAFKSTIALDAGICVSYGIPFLGFETKKGAVCILDRENNKERIRQRLIGLLKGHNINRKNPIIVFLLKEGLLDDDNFVEQLAEELKKLKTKLLIVDSMVRFQKGDENSSQDMNKIYQNITKIQESTECGVLFIHHTKKGTDQYRGSGDLLGQCDAMFKITRKNKEPGFVICNEKNRSGELEDLYGQALIDSNNDVITSIKIEKCEAPAEKEDKESYDCFATARAVIIKYAQEECRSELSTFTKSGLISAQEAWNSDRKDKPISTATLNRALKWLITKKIIVNADKRGVFYYKPAGNEQIGRWITQVEEENTIKGVENDAKL